MTRFLYLRLDVFFVLLSILVLGGLAVYVLQQQTPEKTAEEFLQALAKKDIEKLVQLSYLENPSAPLRGQWDFCVNHAAKNYIFIWNYVNSQRIDEERAAVKVEFMIFHGIEPSYEEPIEIPIILRDGKWKVDLNSLSRKFFPALPK